ncbi:MAG TPA: type II toxin-antitoxin system HicB family antitoxin [bacterium]|nr:type II toxin-antitoxin system HicB family antitoxin [bacterium]
MKYKAILEPQEEGGYTVYVPVLPGCVSEGETIEEALANIKEAIEVYLESVAARGVSLPPVEEYEVAV